MPESPASASLDRFFQYSILGMVASGYAAVATSGSLDLPTILIAGAALLGRTVSVSLRIGRLIPDWVLNVTAIAYVGFYPVDYHYISGEFVAATVHLIFFLGSLLLLKAQSPRDYFFLKLIALMEVLAASILSSGLGYLLFLSAFLLCGAGALMSGEIRAHLSKHKVARTGLAAVTPRLGWLALCVFSGTILVAGALFVVLPRTAHAALRHLVPERLHLPGFANEVRLGQIGEIQQSRIPVMNIRIFDQDLPPAIRDSLKWRGSALAHFDGRRWFNSSERGQRLEVENGQVHLTTSQPHGRDVRRIAYDVQLKSVTGDALFFAGTPEFLRIESPQLIRTSSGGYRTGYPWTRGIRYTAYSYLEPHGPPAAAAAPLPAATRMEHLLLPRLDQRVGNLSRSLTQAAVTQRQKAELIEQYLRTRFQYTLQLPEQRVEDPVSHFLFERKKGHCEYFASAMAVMLRTLEIPSRVATGFQSGTYNPVSGWHLIRSSDAHSWVEAYLDGSGWVTFDPTPPGPGPDQLSLFARMGMYLDAAEVFWQDWIMSYDMERQLKLAETMGESGRRFSLDWGRRWLSLKSAASEAASMWSWPLALAIVGAIAAAMLSLKWLPFVSLWWRSHQRVRKMHQGNAEATDATLLYQRLLAMLERRGFQKPIWTTPAEFAAMLPATSEGAAVVSEFTAAYNELRFGGRREAASRMVQMLSQLERAKQMR